MFFPWNRLDAQIMPGVFSKVLKSVVKKGRTLHLEPWTQRALCKETAVIPQQ